MTEDRPDIKRKLLIALIVLNILLGLAQFIRPAGSQIIPLAFRDCCQPDGRGGSYCCEDCCFFLNDCSGQEECQGATR